MKLTEFSWKEEGGKHVLDCQISIEEDGSYAVRGRNPGEEATFQSAEDLGTALSRAIRERQESSS